MRQHIRKLILFIIIIPLSVGIMGWVFWNQELQYATPTPVPVNFVDVKTGSKIDIENSIPAITNKPTLLHFFNFDCPCSRFNMKDFESTAHHFKNDVTCIVVIQSDDAHDIERFKKKYGLDVQTILDADGKISDKCGIYATPQGVLLKEDFTLYFKGNYNTARYCTNKDTKFIEMAITHMLKNEPLPLSLQNILTEPYGCSLPTDNVDVTGKQSLFDLF